MPRNYTVRYLPIAVDDLISIHDWISVDSPVRATDFVEKLDRLIQNLRRHPLPGKEPRLEKLRCLGYRVLILESCLIFYVVHGRAVTIHRVLHGSRHLEDIL
ncbi:MAG: type II toxin-antitoxin system RelE/ParE family toxin [Nitrospirae bacterium]|nr:type II toxin-antitoxin system RelE/ParE family toxin [Nitrospirota bacterium]